MFIKRSITNENMTVRDARDFLSYLDYNDRFAYQVSMYYGREKKK